MQKGYFCGRGPFDLYIVDSDGDLVPHGTFPAWDDALDGAIDANLPAQQMCVVDRSGPAPRVSLVPQARIPPLDPEMMPAGH